jgi:hypothetical protein
VVQCTCYTWQMKEPKRSSWPCMVTWHVACTGGGLEPCHCHWVQAAFLTQGTHVHTAAICLVQGLTAWSSSHLTLG